MCRQNGFNINMASLEAIEEEEAKENEVIDAEDNAEDTVTSMINTTVTTTGQEEGKTAAAAPTPAQTAAQAFMQAEDDFDAEFFGRKVPQVKLNKGEKRALKFALKSGVNIN
mmetsp:Transcript_26469/g.35388  ORF Transcript_26469/g.35388 Transcript_26469/m.35388 type:complete len:112 (+) Transcript_26469:157-492(+)